METAVPKNRVTSIDLLKGLVMVIMGLDHVRDYFHSGAFLYDPTDATQTTGAVYLTRWVSHFCAPAFCLLAGVSAALSGRKKTKGALSSFLWKRGLWLVIMEFTLVNFAWYFDPLFRTPGLLVIWSLGISMIALAGLIYLPRTGILIFSVILIFGHNLLDGLHFDGNILWSIIHDMELFNLSDEVKLYIDYPVIPWIAVMSLGYYLGGTYTPAFIPAQRNKWFQLMGYSAIGLFIIIRAVNRYGDPLPWVSYSSFAQTLMSFMNPTKYPPSLSYLLMTLGPVFLFLAYFEQLKGKVVNFLSTFGRVPFFYYILHLYLIHILAMIAAEITGFGWQKMILSDWVIMVPELKGYGFNLWVVYLVWAMIIGILYPLCAKFDRYKSEHKEKTWLSYL